MQEAFLTPRVSEDRGDMNSESIPRSGWVNEADYRTLQTARVRSASVLREHGSCVQSTVDHAKQTACPAMSYKRGGPMIQTTLDE